jgi:cytochrome d ubiquinol oxidase subunit I
LLSYEVLTAFFLEATFLGVMLFGWRRVTPRWHCFATCMVALGTLISTFWIISANSWMHTPQGYEIVDGVFEPRDWWAIIFNPSFPYRLTHMTLAAFITTCWVIGGVSARYLWRRRHEEGALVMLKLAIAFAAITVPLQIVVGDLHGLQVRDYQPTKLAAIEANWETQRGAPLILFAVPDTAAEKNHYEVAVPRLGSLILTHEWDGEVQGLNAVPRSERPPVAPVFFAFRVMVGIGLAMLGVVVWSLIQWRRQQLGNSRTVLWAWQLLAPAGFIAVLAGWYVTEIGRQPYVIYGVLRTAEAVSTLDAGTVLTSLIVFAIVYAFVFSAGVVYLFKLLRKGPQPVAAAMLLPEARPVRPFSAAEESIDG